MAGIASRYHIMCQIYLFSSSPPFTVHVLFHYVVSTAVGIVTKAPLCAFSLLHPTIGIPRCSLWQVLVSYRKSQSQRFRVVRWAVKYSFSFPSLILPLTLYYIAIFFLIHLLSDNLSLTSILSLTSVLYFPIFSMDSMFSWFSPRCSHTFSTTLSRLFSARAATVAFSLSAVSAKIAGTFFGLIPTVGCTALSTALHSHVTK